MIRVCILHNGKAFGYDVTDWEYKVPEYDYDNLLCEDLVNRVAEGDILMYFAESEDAEDWCNNHDLEYELVPDDNN